MNYVCINISLYIVKHPSKTHQMLGISVVLFYWHFFEHGDIRDTQCKTVDWNRNQIDSLIIELKTGVKK